MINYLIQINPEVDSRIKNIIEDYWHIEKGKFPNTTAVMFAKYSLGQREITKLVQDYSKCTVTEKCSDCKNDFQREVRVKSDFKPPYYRNPICMKCKEESERVRREQQEEQIRIYREHTSRLERLEAEIKNKFDKAIASKTWLDLNVFELAVLKRIIESKSFSRIKQNVFNGNVHDVHILGIVDKLDKLGLIHVFRTPNNSIETIRFDENLKRLIYHESNAKTNKQDCLSFLLAKNINKIQPRQPDYQGTFTLPTDIVLKAEKYLYGAWLQTDGSLNLKFTPAKDVGSPVKQTRIEDEPKILGDRIKDMFDSLGSDENNEAPF